MTPENVISQVYSEIYLPKPKVLQFESMDRAFQNYENWKEEAFPVISNFWSYQYPILHPYSYWASSHLFNEGFQFDLTREPNKYGCYTIPKYVSKIDIESEFLYRRYLMVSIEAIKNNSPTQADKYSEYLYSKYKEVFNDLSGLIRDEDPTTQMTSEECILLGNFEWLNVEKDMVEAMRKYVRQSVCEQHYQNVSALCNLNAYFLTFRNLVVWAYL